MSYYNYKDIKDTYGPKVGDIIFWANDHWSDSKYKFLLISKVFNKNQVDLTTIPCIDGYRDVYVYKKNTISQFIGVEGQVFIIC